MNAGDPYKKLGLSRGATERQIKAAYRKLALRYHPDLNQAPDAQQKFQEIHKAYELLLHQGGDVQERQFAHEEAMAGEVLRRERARRQQQVRARAEKKRREDEMFNRPEWHDPILLVKYAIHGFGLIFAVAAVIAPILIAIFNDPASLAGTFFFMVAGVVLLFYIYSRRRTWFQLGKFKTGWGEVRSFFKMGSEKQTRDHCCYLPNAMAGGKPYRIELFKIMDVKVRSYGALNHRAGYKNRVKRMVIPRSVRAHFFHRISSLIKLTAIVTCLIFFPVESVLWRFLAGILAGGLLSTLVLAFARVRSKVAYLITPGLILKMGIWIFALFMISIPGPGFNIQTTAYVYLMVAGLLFLLDMFFDLVVGLFPFYPWMFRPVIRQGKIMDGLYREGYQNYQELPVYSVLYPLFRWLF